MTAPFAELKLESMRLMPPTIYVTSHKPLVPRQPPIPIDLCLPLLLHGCTFRRAQARIHAPDVVCDLRDFTQASCVAPASRSAPAPHAHLALAPARLAWHPHLVKVRWSPPKKVSVFGLYGGRGTNHPPAAPENRCAKSGRPHRTLSSVFSLLSLIFLSDPLR
jgi:hypothetical protein